MKISRVLAPLLGLALVATTAAAQLPTSGSTGTVKFLGGSGVGYGGVQVGAYNFAIPGMSSIPAYCVDFTHYVNTSSSGYTARFTSVQDLIDGTSLSDVRWGALSGAAGRYQRAAWLATQFALNPVPPNANSVWGGIHGAIWNEFTPGQPNWSVATPWTTTASTANLNNMNWDWWMVMTPVDDQGNIVNNQEFLVYVTPEPATILLLATGLFGVFGAAAYMRLRA